MAADLAFRIFAVDDASVVFKRISGSMAETGAVAERTSASTLNAGKSFQRFASYGAASAVLAVGAGLRMAASFESQTTTLVTSAGESQKALGMIGAGVRQIAVETGTSTTQLIKGLYTIESAGYHGATGLQILTAAAKGARAENADLGTVANAVTTVFKGFSAQGYTATDVVNALTATVQQGKTNLEDLAGALATVSPAASTAGISMTQMLGAMSVMTGAGVSADKAATGLRQTILSLEAPTVKQQAIMKGLGIDSVSLSKNLGKVGLVGTLDQVTDAIQAHMGPAGTVLIDSLKKAATAGTDFDSQLQKMAPTQRSYVGALADMFGGTKSLQGALILTANGGKALAAASGQIADKVRGNKNEIMGWAEVQETLNLKLQVLQARVKDVVLGLGQELIPVASKILGVFGGHLAVIIKIVPWILAFAVAIKVVTLATKAWAFIQTILDGTLLANPIGLIIVAVAALATGILYLATKTKFFQTVWADLKIAFKAVTDSLTSAWSAVSGGFMKGWNAVQNAFSSGINWVKSFISKWWPYILGTLLLGPVGLLAVTIYRHWSDITGAFSSAINAIKAFVAKWWPYVLLTIITGGLILVAAAVYRNWSTITGFFSSAINGIKSFVAKWWPYILVTVLTGGLGLLVLEVAKNWGKIQDFFSTPIMWIKNFVMKWWPYILVTVLTGGLGLLVLEVAKHWDTIKTAFSNALGAIVHFVTSTVPSLVLAAGKLMAGFFTGMWGQLTNLPGWLLRNLSNVVLHGIPSLFSSGWSMIRGLFDGMWGVLKDTKTWIRDNVYDKIVKAIKDLFGIKSPSTVMAGLGGHLIGGLIKGIVFSAANAGAVLKNALGGLTGIAKAVLGNTFGGLLADLGGAGKFASHLGGSVLKSIGGFFGGLFGGGGASGGNAGSQAIVKAMAASMYGWVGSQWNALQALLMGESGFNANAVNPASGAAGIFQSLSHGPVPMGNAAAQAAWGLPYIAGRYGTPENAYAAWLGRSPHWYGSGGIFTSPQIIGVGERGPEAVIPLSRAGGGLGGPTVHVHLPNATIIGANRRQAADQLRALLRQSLRGAGRPGTADVLL